MAAGSHRQDSKGGDLSDSRSMSDFMKVLSPTVGAREVILDQLKAEHEEIPKLVLRTTSARIGVWEDGLLAYQKSVK